MNCPDCRGELGPDDLDPNVHVCRGCHRPWVVSITPAYATPLPTWRQGEFASLIEAVMEGST